MLKKVLIANRGEIAIRIIRTCKEMGIRTVAVYSAADKNSLHVSMADEALCIGAAPAKLSYLNMSAILQAAKASGADAIHPGYGFLAENAEFAELCENQDICFVGPSPDAIRRMGDKGTAKSTMQIAGVPIIPGTNGLVADIDTAVREAARIGYPVLVKATAGGGGKGMKEADNEETLRRIFPQAQKEAEAAFGNGGVYLEKYMLHPRHIEVQIMADKHGNVIYLGDRDCSVQRRHQKLIEEAPASRVDAELKRRMGRAAVLAAKAVKYSGAGTVEFLVDYGKFYFLEMNTRIQVEHPVTEWVTGTDLIALQLLAAGGEALPIRQEDVVINGVAVECRINAENPAKGFLPSPGKIKKYRAPGGFGVRIDSAAFEGWEIPPFYDSMVAKCIVWGKDRTEAINRMQRVLKEFVIDGVTTTAAFQLKVLEHPAFIKGEFDTSFLERYKLEK